MWSRIMYKLQRIWPDLWPALLGLAIGSVFVFWTQDCETDRLNACIPDCAPYSVVSVIKTLPLVL
jgi:hypothetical protein